jgi:hypothetical protein
MFGAADPYGNTNLPAPALERVARGVGDELVEDHSEPPATLCRQLQRLGGKRECDFPVLQFGATY